MSLMFEHDPEWPWPYERFADMMLKMKGKAPSLEEYNEMVSIIDITWPDIVSGSPEMHPDAAELYREHLTPDLRKSMMESVVTEFGADPVKAEAVYRELEEAIESPLRNQKPSFFP